MINISDKISESLSEYVVLPGWIKAKPDQVSLETKLGENISLQYSMMTARMQCVTGRPKSIVRIGGLGILTNISRNFRDEDKQELIDASNDAKLKKGDINFINEPESAKPETEYQEVLKLVERTGYSIIPILDRFSKLEGIYIDNPDQRPSVLPKTPISKVMTPLKGLGNERGIPFLEYDNKDEIKKVISRERINFLPIINDEKILQKLAFLQKFDTNYIGLPITSKEKWEEELKKWGPQVDTSMTDSSNICFDDAKTIVQEAKIMYPDKPFGIGNLVRGIHFKEFADIYIELAKKHDLPKIAGIYFFVGMGGGDACKTGKKRRIGRGLFTALYETSLMRDKYFKETGFYFPIVADGGIRDVEIMIVAYTMADLVMVGRYASQTIESAGRKFEDDEGEVEAKEESRMNFVEYWGEGTPKAMYVSAFGMDYEEVIKSTKPEDIERVLERYLTSISTATIEGIVGLIPVKGRLKPTLEDDMKYLRATIANTGASNIREYHELAVLEKCSEKMLEDMAPHKSVITKEDK